MRFVNLVLFCLVLAFSGCIKHSDQPLNRKSRMKQAEEKATLKKLTPNLMVENVNQTMQFYKKAFGFEPVVTVPDTGTYSFAVLELGKVDIMVQSRESFAEDFGLGQDSAIGGTISLYIEVNDIVSLYDKASVNSDIVKELHQTFFGTKEFSVKDNNGYILTFSEALKK
ncbi:MAG: VOC family protein [Bacillota bacterium]